MSDIPKRPLSAYMLWLNSTVGQIKADNPGLKVTEIAKKGGEIWRAMKDKSVWEEKAAKAKEQYTKDLESYNANGGGAEVGGKEAAFFRKNVKMSDIPKRPLSAYMLWLNSTVGQIKADNPGLKVTEIAKKGGEIWRAMKDKSVWEEKAAKAKEQYTKDLESYNANGGGAEVGGKEAAFAREQYKAKIWRAMEYRNVWEEKAAKDKEQYTEDLESYNANGGGAGVGEKEAALNDFS